MLSPGSRWTEWLHLRWAGVRSRAVCCHCGCVGVWVCAGGARKGERKWVGGQMKEWEEMKVRESNKFLNADLFDLAGLSGCGHSAELPQGFKGYYSSQCQYMPGHCRKCRLLSSGTDDNTNLVRELSSSN